MLFLRAECVCNSAIAGSSGSTYAVDVCFRHVGHIVVYHDTKILYINTSGGYVCCNDYAALSAFEIL